MICARCGQDTDDETQGTQGHYWRFCKVTKRMASRFHFCCPGDCELDANEPKETKTEILVDGEWEDITDQRRNVA